MGKQKAVIYVGFNFVGYSGVKSLDKKTQKLMLWSMLVYAFGMYCKVGYIHGGVGGGVGVCVIFAIFTIY